MKRKLISYKLYKKISARDKFTCQICGKRGEWKNFWNKTNSLTSDRLVFCCGVYYKHSLHGWVRMEIDHVIPVCLGGEHLEENMQLTCRYCNRSKGAKYALC